MTDNIDTIYKSWFLFDDKIWNNMLNCFAFIGRVRNAGRVHLDGYPSVSPSLFNIIVLDVLDGNNRSLHSIHERDHVRDAFCKIAELGHVETE